MFRKIRKWRERRIVARHPIPERLWQDALQRCSPARRLGASDQASLRVLATLFLQRKSLEPTEGLQLNDADRVLLATHACVPILKLGLDWYDGWVGIVVHPSDFKVQRAETGEDGVVHEWNDELAGESWPGGPVVLSWEALDDAGSVAEGGVNIVIHEFAHKLDMMSGAADGVPPLPTREARAHWIAVFAAEFDRFCKSVDAGKQTFLDPYAAEHEAEFFAVASEAFFESPNSLKEDYPRLYELFTGFYKQDPARRLTS